MLKKIKSEKIQLPQEEVKKIIDEKKDKFDCKNKIIPLKTIFSRVKQGNLDPHSFGTDISLTEVQ